MKMKKAAAGRGLRRSISLLLALLMTVMMAPTALSVSVGTSSSAVSDSTAMSFIKLTAAVNIFLTETTPSSGAVSVPAGTVLMLASTDTYTVTVSGVSTEYGCVYYNSARYNVTWSDVSACVMPSCSVVEMRSMSLTTRERMSPFECES